MNQKEIEDLINRGFIIDTNIKHEKYGWEFIADKYYISESVKEFFEGNLDKDIFDDLIDIYPKFIDIDGKKYLCYLF